MKYEVFKETSDNFCGTYDLLIDYYGTIRKGVVSVKFGKLHPVDELWRVCVWGNDDFGLEKDFNNENEAWECFIGIIKLKDVTIEALHSLGFKEA